MPAWRSGGTSPSARQRPRIARSPTRSPSRPAYLVTLGHRMRYVIKLNAREAMHMIELRTSPQGHPSYRQICQEMLRLIDEVAGHHLVARAMRFAGSDDVHLPRYAAEAASTPPLTEHRKHETPVVHGAVRQCHADVVKRRLTSIAGVGSAHIPGTARRRIRLEPCGQLRVGDGVQRVRQHVPPDPRDCSRSSASRRGRPSATQKVLDAILAFFPRQRACGTGDHVHRRSAEFGRCSASSASWGSSGAAAASSRRWSSRWA